MSDLLPLKIRQDLGSDLLCCGVVLHELVAGHLDDDAGPGAAPAGIETGRGP